METLLPDLQLCPAEDKKLYEEKLSKLQHLLFQSMAFAQFLLNRIEHVKEQDELEFEECQKYRDSAKKPASEKEFLATNEGPDSNSSFKEEDNFVKLSQDTLRRIQMEKIPALLDSQKARNSPTCSANEEAPLKASQPCETSQPETSLLRKLMEKFPLPCKINGELVPAGQPLLMTGGVLRDYQVFGLQWLHCLLENGVNCVLADEMGLGKSVQCVALLCRMILRNTTSPFLIIAPLSTLTNWLTEFQRFAPELPVYLYHGSKGARELLRPIFKQMHRRLDGHILMPSTILTSYELAMQDTRSLGCVKWSTIILDEGHRIKNSGCKLIKRLTKYECEHRLLLSGTPLQNNISELWTLLHYLMPQLFDDLDLFRFWFDLEKVAGRSAELRELHEEQKEHIISCLHQVLSPFLLRRMKSDIDLKIPPKKEMVVYAPLTTLQHSLYIDVLNRTINAEQDSSTESGSGSNNSSRAPSPSGSSTSSSSSRPPKRKAATRVKDYSIFMDDPRPGSGRPRGRPRVRFPWKQHVEDKELIEWVEALWEHQRLVESDSAVEAMKRWAKIRCPINLSHALVHLRKCCNHPFLMEFPIDSSGELLIDESLVTSSGKMMVLSRLLQRLKDDGRKVLLYTQMTSLLHILEEFCTLRSYRYCRLDGTMSLIQRTQQISEFNTQPEVFLFLLSTRAGGLGINLSAADTVIIYDSDWNPQCDLQAQARCHRIGQSVPVLIYRLVTKATIDEKIYERAGRKRKLEKMVLASNNFKRGLTSSVDYLTATDLLSLVTCPHHVSVVHGDTLDADKVLTSRELDELMDRSELWNKWSQSLQAAKNAIPGTVGGDKTDKQPVSILDGMCFTQTTTRVRNETNSEDLSESQVTATLSCTGPTNLQGTDISGVVDSRCPSPTYCTPFSSQTSSAASLPSVIGDLENVTQSDCNPNATFSHSDAFARSTDTFAFSQTEVFQKPVPPKMAQPSSSACDITGVNVLFDTDHIVPSVCDQPAHFESIRDLENTLVVP